MQGKVWIDRLVVLFLDWCKRLSFSSSDGFFSRGMIPFLAKGGIFKHVALTLWNLEKRISFWACRQSCRSLGSSHNMTICYLRSWRSGQGQHMVWWTPLLMMAAAKWFSFLPSLGSFVAWTKPFLTAEELPLFVGASCLHNVTYPMG